MKLLSAILLSLFCVASQAANVRLYFPATTNNSVLLTNPVQCIPISGNILSSGGVIPIGKQTRITFGADGIATNFFSAGYYALTNTLLADGGIVIRVYDNGTQLYDYTNLLWSGYNKFVGIYGTNLPPSFDSITNALGFNPLSPTQSTNGWRAADLVVSNGLSDRLIATNNILYSLIQTAANNGITAATATNIARAISSTNNTSGNADSATNIVFGGNIGHANGIRIFKNDSDNSVGFVGENNETNLIIRWSASGGAGVEVKNIEGYGGGLTGIVSSVNATNIYGAGLVTMTNAALTVSGVATNSLSGVLVTRITNATNDLNSTLGTRLIATNTSLVAQLNSASNVLRLATINATNDLNATLAARIIATNSAILATVTNLDVVTSNGVIAATFNQTNTYKVRAIAAGSGVTVTTNAADGLYTIDASAGAGGGIPTLAGSGTNTTLYFNSANWGTNGTLSGNGAILSGRGNTLLSSDISVIAGGVSNYISGIGLGANNFIGGGFGNAIPGYNNSQSVIVGGLGNRILGATSEETISGGASNIITAIGGAAARATISGGYQNQAFDIGATIPGGYSNYAVRASFAAGTKAQAANRASFVWSDDQAAEFTTTGTNQFIVRSLNGVGINTNNPSGNALRVIGQTATDNLAIGNRMFSQYTTNNVAVNNAGTAAANGTYRLVNSSHYTNDFTASVITNNTSGNWQIKNGTTVLYSGSTPVTATTIQSGSSPAPSSFFGSYLHSDGVVVRGVISSTNLDERINNQVLTNVTLIKNAMASGTNTVPLTAITGAGANQVAFQHASNGKMTQSANLTFNGTDLFLGTEAGGTPNGLQLSDSADDDFAIIRSIKQPISSKGWGSTNGVVNNWWYNGNAFGMFEGQFHNNYEYNAYHLGYDWDAAAWYLEGTGSSNGVRYAWHLNQSGKSVNLYSPSIASLFVGNKVGANADDQKDVWGWNGTNDSLTINDTRRALSLVGSNIVAQVGTNSLTVGSNGLSVAGYFPYAALSTASGNAFGGTINTTPVKISTYSTALSSRFGASAANGTITNTSAGVYECGFYFDLLGDVSSADSYTFTLYTNGVACPLVQTSVYAGTEQNVSCGKTVLFPLAANTWCEVRVRSGSITATDAAISQGSFFIKTQ